MWQQLELASELESDLQDSAVCGRKWLFYLNAGKTQLLSFDLSNDTGLTNVKMDGCVLEFFCFCLFFCSFKMLRLTFSSKFDWGSYIISFDKTTSKKIGALIRSISFFLLRLFCISVNLPYHHTWNTVVMSGLLLLVATWNCWISYKNGYARLLVLHLLPLLNPCSQSKCS